MRIWSDDFENGEMIPEQFTCDGEDISPHLAWSDMPERTKSLAIIMEDPDAPGGTFTHWMVHGIDPEVREKPRASATSWGREVENDFGKAAYGGPCPPEGTHRYFFRLCALDVEDLDEDLDEDAGEEMNKAVFHRELAKHKLDEATLAGVYMRRAQREAQG